MSLRGMHGILEYEPSEFTFTALAGTPVSEINRVLEERNQYLPFDPMLVNAGATLGGTVASGLSGPGRFRYGGVRDFLLGVRFVSGDGEVINAGGKVVKNAAGFDIPKFLVGSMGRFGVMVEMTFKVFPHSRQQRSLAIRCASVDEAMSRMADAAASRWELDAMDYRPGEEKIFIRLSGPDQVNEAIAEEIAELWQSDMETVDAADHFWQSVGELNWNGEDSDFAVKVPTTPPLVTELCRWRTEHPGCDLHVSVGGGVAWLLLDTTKSVDELSAFLRERSSSGLVIRGDYSEARIGSWSETEIAAAVKLAMDPCEKFPGF